MPNLESFGKSQVPAHHVLSTSRLSTLTPILSPVDDVPGGKTIAWMIFNLCPAVIFAEFLSFCAVLTVSLLLYPFHIWSLTCSNLQCPSKLRKVSFLRLYMHSSSLSGFYLLEARFIQLITLVAKKVSNESPKTWNG